MNRVFPAVKAIIRRNETFLVIKQELPGSAEWDLPGGRVEYGESPYDTLIREVQEETTLSVTISKPLGMYWFFRQDDDQVACTVFLCTANGEIDLSNNPTVELLSEYRWVTKDEFLKEEYTVSHISLKKLISEM